ncbi:MAG: ABC transporter permease subunit [Candidatus Heimdallarchaeota archaeon]|nr:ABC transporter permease subunit [Candidatus Heimdallarchaeota archaeon]MCG3252755.1 ABC transporter permease subunit [Candidatus Heimdallarchaeota archaeon]MCK4289892.1 ABC transporter permease subunit [Candidatus Heimdallarchaeota archaeon]
MVKEFFKKIRKDKVNIIFRKEVKELLKNREILVTVIIMPIIFSLLIPISMITLNFAEDQEIPESDQVPEIFRNLAPFWDESTDLQKVSIVQANLYLAFLIMIPMMVPMAISSDSIAGEKERKTIEGLLAAPITKEEILIGKALAAAVPSIVISWIAEIIYIISTDIILHNIMGRIILPNLFAAIMFIFLMPTQTLLSTLLMTSFSSKARGSREALQKSGFFAIPIIFIVSALIFLPLLVHPSLTLVSEVVLILLMIIILRRATKNFNRNKLLSVGS